MSKIRDALRHLQTQGGESKETTAAKEGAGGTPEAIVPIVRNKKVEVAGVKHHINESSLVRGGLLAPLDRAAPVTDEFRRIKRPLIDNVLKADQQIDEYLNVIMVASPLPGAGKTFCTVNLAASISLERELNVLLVDADVSKSHITRAFGLGERPGLIDLLEDDSLSVVDVLVRTDMNDIQVLPSGRRHGQSTELLASERMAEVVGELAKRYPDRIIIMDSPPLLITSEAQAVAREAGQIVFVVESGKSTNQEIQEALELLDPTKAINLILNKSVYTQQGSYYGGAYGNYGTGEAD